MTRPNNPADQSESNDTNGRLVTRSRKATLIYNPHAGPVNYAAMMDGVAELWRAHGWSVTVTPTEHAGHATDLARAAADAGDGLVIAVGGDGTFNEVVNGLAGSETALAPLPAGTGNSFAFELGLLPSLPLPGPRLLGASRALLQGRIHHIDLGQMDNGRYFFLWAGIGADSFAIHQIEPRSKRFKRLGRLGYVAKAFYYLTKFKGIDATVTVDEQRFAGRVLLITVSNCQKFGGGVFPINPDGRMDDGEIEVWLFPGRRWTKMLRYMLMTAFGRHATHPDVRSLRGKQVAITTTPLIPVHIDAEPDTQTPFRCHIEPKVLKLLVPPSASASLFREPGEPLQPQI